ncbi:MAG: DUF4160 domain-containing protein [Deltaproteobacteria bacterium]
MRFRTCRLTIYPDEHGVPHFHLEFTDGDRCSIEIESLTVLAGSVSPEKKMAEALKWASMNRFLLLEKWKEITK